MSSSRASVLSSAISFAATFVACGDELPAPVPDKPVSASPSCTPLDKKSTQGCPTATCGGNSPFVNVFPVIGVNPKGCSNSEGVHLRTAVGPTDADVKFHSRRCHAAVSLGIRDNPSRLGWELVGRDANGATIEACAGAELAGTEFSFQHGTKDAGMIVLRVGTIRTKHGRDMLAYVLGDPDNTSPANEWPSLCDPIESRAFRTRLGQVKEEPEPEHCKTCPAECKTCRPGSGVSEETALSPELLGRRRFLPAMAGTLSRLAEEEMGQSIVILSGEIYDGTATIKQGNQRDIVPDWFNFACVGDGLAKVHMERNFAFDASTTGLNKRQAAVKMETALYCKPDSSIDPSSTTRSHTVRGVRVEAHLKGNIGGRNPVEARWNEAGAICLGQARVYSTNRIVQRDVLPDTCKTTGCETAAQFREALSGECGTTFEPCAPKHTDWIIESTVADYE